MFDDVAQQQKRHKQLYHWNKNAQQSISGWCAGLKYAELIALLNTQRMNCHTLNPSDEWNSKSIFYKCLGRDPSTLCTPEQTVISAADCRHQHKHIPFPHPQLSQIHKHPAAVSVRGRDKLCPWSAVTQASSSRHDHCLSLVSYAVNYLTMHMFGRV